MIPFHEELLRVPSKEGAVKSFKAGDKVIFIGPCKNIEGTVTGKAWYFEEDTYWVAFPNSLYNELIKGSELKLAEEVIFEG